MKDTRIGWMDGVRLLAMLWILFVHFVVVFTANISARFPGVWGLVLFGITGKLAVACFCVLTGYFAAGSGDMPLTRYALRRYLSFALQILLIELIYFAITRLVPGGLHTDVFTPGAYLPHHQVLVNVLRDAFLLQSNVIPTYWCMADLVLGSIAVYAVNRLTRRLALPLRFAACAALFAAALLLGYLWVAVCALGYLLRLLTQVRIPRPAVIVLIPLLVCLLPWLIRRGECDLTYLLDGVACLIVLWVVGQLPVLQRLLGAKLPAFLGGHTQALFLLHIPVYHLCEVLLRVNGLSRPAMPWPVVQFVTVLALTVAAALAWDRLCARTLRPFVDRLCRPLRLL